MLAGLSGSGNFSSIQEAIDASVDGDMIFVYDGTYFEEIDVNKSVELVGQSNTSTLVYGGFNVSADYVSIANFKITNGFEWDPDGTGKNGAYRSAIYVSSSFNSFQNNSIIQIVGGEGTDEYGFQKRGGTGGLSKDYAKGGNGGIAAGVFCLNSNHTNVYGNTFNVITGGLGGIGDQHKTKTNGDGGVGSGVYLQNSHQVTVNCNVRGDIVGGNGGPHTRRGGIGGVGSGVYCLSSSQNTIQYNILHKTLD